jgi:hypothetical protein
VEKIELMHSIYGTKEKCICWDCHFCHWKLAGKGENKRVDYIWCEVYGINKENMNDTAWKWKYPACGYYNVCHDAPKKNIWKLANKELVEQVKLF